MSAEHSMAVVRTEILSNSPAGTDCISFSTAGERGLAFGIGIQDLDANLAAQLMELQGRKVIGVMREGGVPFGLIFEGGGTNMLSLMKDGVPAMRVGWVAVSPEQEAIAATYDTEEQRELGETVLSLLHRMGNARSFS